MHPAVSVIFFSSLSGAGFGLVFLTGTMLQLGQLPGDRAFSLATLITATAVIALHWAGVADLAAWLSPAWLMAAFMAIVTVVCTAMIYASLKPVRQWHNGWIVPIYLSFALTSGAFLLMVICALARVATGTTVGIAIAAAVIAWILKLFYWRAMENTDPLSNMNSATGLRGDISPFDPPHTEKNYLLREMGYRIARSHRAKLRRIALVFGLALPVLLAGAHIAFPGLGSAVVIAAALFSLAGIFVERWLFFAEAEHTVTLYYRAPDRP